MTTDELQSQLNATWCREQSADDAHDTVWGEPFDGETVRISDIAEIIDKPDYTNPEGMVRRLREAIQANDKSADTGSERSANE
jgi:hypothetical protein